MWFEAPFSLEDQDKDTLHIMEFLHPFHLLINVSQAHHQEPPLLCLQPIKEPTKQPHLLEYHHLYHLLIIEALLHYFWIATEILHLQMHTGKDEKDVSINQ